MKLKNEGEVEIEETIESKRRVSCFFAKKSIGVQADG